LTYQFYAFPTEMQNAKHILEIKKSLFCWNETNIKSVNDPKKLEVTNSRRKSFQKYKRNILTDNKYPEVPVMMVHCYTSASTASQYCLWSFNTHNGLSI